MTTRRFLPLGLLAAAVSLAPMRANAYTTRVHIMLANQIREALIAADDATIALQMSEESVVLTQEDFEALRDFPLEFRAGAVGPDNMVFPGMTDPSHALGQRPYEQCELLYTAALTGDERAYALGCFLHGATDAIAHHYVNYMTGETFTLNPITSDRATSLTNVARHILAESAIQDAAYTQAPDRFNTGAMLHLIPTDFVLRTYLSEESPLWQLMTTRPLAEYEEARAAMPDAPLPSVLATMDVAAAEHLMLSPVYLAEVEQVIVDQRATLVQAIADMQDPATAEGSVLLVTPGNDGELGTDDDGTDCSFSCGTLYATYFTYVGLLAPRFSAGGLELPPAFDKIADELRTELFAFHPAYLATAANVSAKINAPITAKGGGIGFSSSEVQGLFQPMLDWSNDVATIDYDTLVIAVLPNWIVQLDTAMQAVGVDVNLTGIIEAVFQPFIAPIRQAIEDAFIAQAEVFLRDLADTIEAEKDTINAEYSARLDAAAPADLDGNMLDYVYQSGLFAHSFNIAAATMANHAAVLPIGEDPIGVGPASFDASYTASWMQAGACAHLSEVIFPLGVDVVGAMSVRMDGNDFVANSDQDSPVECHDGAIGSFAAMPSLLNCALTDLATLLGAPTGSLSRAYPPSLSMNPVACEGTEIPGLPPAPQGEDDTGSGTAGGADDGSGTGVGGDATAGVDAGTGTGSAGGADGGGDDGGCSCRQGGGAPSGAGWLAVLGLLGLRRRRGLMAASIAAAAAAGCGDDGSGAMGGGTQGGTATSGNTTGPGGQDSAGETTAASMMTGGSTTATASGTADDTMGTTEDPPDNVVLDSLDGTVWYGEQTRDGVTRAYELAFDSTSLLWTEVRNPYGPARRREMRVMVPGADGDVTTTVISPQGWPIHPDNGATADWSLAVVDGMLEVTRDGVTETFTEGPWPAPTSGLTATVRVFEVGGVVDQAFCDSGLSGFDYPALFGFANGQSDEIVATDVVAGAQLLTWSNPGGNNFSIVDVDGFDQLGGTELSDTFNFFVTYEGTLAHPGGALSMRELDDSVEDVVWVFLEDAVGSSNEAELFLEVHGFGWPEASPDEPSTDLPAGDVAIQAILVRCTEAIVSVDVQVDTGAGWGLVGDADSAPLLNDGLFPPAM